jgi:hypothetical protein
MTNNWGPINKRYFILPVLLGIFPSAICGIVHMFIVVFGDSVPHSFLAVALFYMLFISLYAYPPALIAYFFGIKVYGPTAETLIAFPDTVLSWVIVDVFYLVVGLLINRLFKIRYRVATIRGVSRDV